MPVEKATSEDPKPQIEAGTALLTRLCRIAPLPPLQIAPGLVLREARGRRGPQG